MIRPPTSAAARKAWRTGTAVALGAMLIASSTALARPAEPTVDLYGSVLIHSMTTEGDLPDSFECTGRGALADIAPGGSVIVADQDHVLLGKGRLTGSVTAGPGICAFAMVVEDLPAEREAYRVRISYRGEILLEPDELTAPVDLVIAG